MEKIKTQTTTTKLYNNDWVDSLQNIVDKTEHNLKGLGDIDATIYRPTHQTPICYEEDTNNQRAGLNNNTFTSKQHPILLLNFKFRELQIHKKN